MRKMKPFPSRFVRLTLYEKSAGAESSAVILASSNSHPYVDPNTFVSAEKLAMRAGSNCRLVFDYCLGLGQVFASCRVRAYNFGASENIFLKLEKGAKVKLEAGYNGFALDNIIEGYTIDKPFIEEEDAGQSCTVFGVTTREPAFLEEVDISLPAKTLGDFVAQIEEVWGVKLKFDAGVDLTAKINLTLRGDLEGALACLGALCGLRFVHEYGRIFQGFYPIGRRAEGSTEVPREVAKGGVIGFELYFKARAEGGGVTLKDAATKASFDIAEEGEGLEGYDLPFAFDAPAVPENTVEEGDAKMQLFLQGGFRLGNAVAFVHNGVRLNFAVQGVSIIGDTHGTGADFVTELLLNSI